MPNHLARDAPNQPAISSSHLSIFSDLPTSISDLTDAGSESLPMLNIPREKLEKPQYSSPAIEALLEGHWFKNGFVGRIADYFLGTSSENNKDKNSPHDYGFLDEPETNNREARLTKQKKVRNANDIPNVPSQPETSGTKPFCYDAAHDSLIEAFGPSTTVDVKGPSSNTGGSCYEKNNVSACFEEIDSTVSAWDANGKRLIPLGSPFSCWNPPNISLLGKIFDNMVFTNISFPIDTTFDTSNQFRNVWIFSSEANLILNQVDVADSFQIYNSTASSAVQLFVTGETVYVDLAFPNGNIGGASVFSAAGSNIAGFTGFFSNATVLIFDNGRYQKLSFTDKDHKQANAYGSYQFSGVMASLKNLTVTEDFRSTTLFFSEGNGYTNNGRVRLPADCADTKLRINKFGTNSDRLDCTMNQQSWCYNQNKVGEDLRGKTLNTWCADEKYRHDFNRMLEYCNSNTYPFIGSELTANAACEETTVNSGFNEHTKVSDGHLNYGEFIALPLVLAAILSFTLAIFLDMRYGLCDKEATSGCLSGPLSFFGCGNNNPSSQGEENSIQQEARSYNTY